MTGAQFKRIREGLELSHLKFAKLIGYTGSLRNIETRIRKLERETQVPLHLARYVWLIDLYARQHNGNLPHWPNSLLIEGEDEPWT